MATRSLIGKLNPDNTVDFIYCHWDGYPEGVGETLKHFYTDPLKVDELLALGDLSVLGEVIGEQHDGSKFNNDSNWCTAHGRDMGKENSQAERNIPLEVFLGMDFRGEDFKYLFGTNFKWQCFEYDGTPVRLENENVN